MLNQSNNTAVNTITLSKGSYDNMRSTNDRANMLLDRIMNTIMIEVDSDNLSMDTDTVLKTIEILYPDTYKKKVSALKRLRTKNFLDSRNSGDNEVMR